MEVVIDNRDELDARLMEKISKHECIHEPELLNRITDLLVERDILIDDIQSYHDKVKDMSESNTSKMKYFDVKSIATVNKEQEDAFGKYLQERKNTKLKVPKFEEGYVVIDVTDNHILDNKVFDKKEDAEELKKTYYHEMPSLIDNHYVVMKCCSDCLSYGAFPYEKNMYFIYDMEI